MYQSNYCILFCWFVFCLKMQIDITTRSTVLNNTIRDCRELFTSVEYMKPIPYTSIEDVLSTPDKAAAMAEKMDFTNQAAAIAKAAAAAAAAATAVASGAVASGKGRKRKSASATEEQQQRQAADYDLAFTSVLFLQNLQIFWILGDGNCLFRSLSHQLYGTDKHYHRVRLEIMDYIQLHADKYRSFMENNVILEEYVVRMKEDKQWGGELEISVAAELYKKIQIILHYKQNVIPTRTFGQEEVGKRILRISYHNGNHYNSVVPFE